MIEIFREILIIGLVAIITSYIIILIKNKIKSKSKKIEKFGVVFEFETRYEIQRSIREKINNEC